MPDSSKYDIFMDELLSLEKQMGVFALKSDEIAEANAELREQVIRLEEENRALKNKIKEIELQLSSPAGNDDVFENTSITAEEREEIKNKISKLISKLDYHLRS